MWPHPPVCLVAPLYAPATGGVERYVERLASGLHARGIPVEIVTTDPASRHPSAEIREGIPVRRFPTIRGDRLFYPSPALTRWLRHNAARYSLMHAHNLHTLVPMVAAWTTRSAGTPLVLTAHWHGTGHTPARRLLHVPYRPAAGWVARTASAIVGNSQNEAALLRRDFGPRLPITVIPEGIELPTRPLGSPAHHDPDGLAGGVTVLSVGRLEAYKGVARVVQAMASLPTGHRLVVVGQGTARDTISAAAAAAGLGDRIVLRGRVPDDELQAWYQRAAAFVSLSSHESFGLSVLEAAAAGVPVVASDIPAHQEARGFVPDGRITLVPETGDGPPIAGAITSAIAQGRADDRLGWHLPTWDMLVDRTLAIYRSVLDTP
ncbi:MAG: glycosyltransferase family 4 protein [Chloroflexi bacterium]|nr:glycosyltransferase family 4 protein [Chloroflexota bacterium]